MARIGLYLANLDVAGAQRVVVTLSKAFAARGHDVDLVVVGSGGPLERDLDSQVSLVALECDRALTAIPSLARYLRDSCPDVLVSSLTYLNVTALLAAFVARRGTRVAVVEHNTKPDPDGTNAPIALARLLYPRADAVVAVSEGVAANVATWSGLPRSAIDVAYNPIVTPSLREDAAEPPDHEWYQRSDRSIVFGAGRHVEEKDHETLLRAFARVERRTGAKCVLAGDGPLTDEYRELCRQLGVADAVDFPGTVRDVSAYMAHADVFVLSSRSEGFGNVLVEAMACGTPVVATDCPSGPAEILQDGAYGRLVDVGAPVQLARAILETLAEWGDDSAHASAVDEAAVRARADEAASRDSANEAPLRGRADEAPLRERTDEAALRARADEFGVGVAADAYEQILDLD